MQKENIPSVCCSLDADNGLSVHGCHHTQHQVLPLLKPLPHLPAQITSRENKVVSHSPLLVKETHIMIFLLRFSSY